MPRIYRLPSFHLLCNIWTQNPRGTITGLRQAMVSCQMVGHSRDAITILKLPKHTQIQVASTISNNFIGDLVNIADQPTNYWEAIEWTRVAAGYDNEYDSYAIRLSAPPAPNPHD